MKSNKKQALVIFAKEPILGKVKTRLARDIGPQKSLALYQAFLLDITQIFNTFDSDFKIIAYSAPDTVEPEFLKRLPGDWDMIAQKGADLGERMNQAFRHVQQMGAHQTVIMGSDAPSLPINFIEQAFDQLEQHDIVLGPTQDGGYYLIGLQEPCFALFNNIQWSSSTVFQMTIDNARKLNKKVFILPMWYDIDNIEDLAKLRSDIEKTRAASLPKTLRVIKEIV